VNRVAVPGLDELVADPARARQLPPTVAAELLIRVIGLQTALATRALAAPEGGPTEAPAEDQWLTIPEVAARLRFAKSYVYQLARRADLPALRKGKYWRVRLADLHQWEAALSKNPFERAVSTVLRSPRDRRRRSAGSATTPADPSAARHPARRPPDHGVPMGARRGAHP
jgi:excisionase family DNA binding protein